VNAVVTDSRDDRVELNHILHQSGQGGSAAPVLGNHIETTVDEVGGEGLRDEPAANDDNLNKAHAPIKGESFLLKVDLIPGSHGMFNSSVIKANPFRNLEESVCRTWISFTISG